MAPVRQPCFPAEEMSGGMIKEDSSNGCLAHTAMPDLAEQLHSPTALLETEVAGDDSTVTDWYEGVCPQTGMVRRLPRTALVEAIARGLMAELATDERYGQDGKMYGVLLVADQRGGHWVLKAFSGLLNGQGQRPGWVPPIPGRADVQSAEAATLAALTAMQQELLTLQQLPVRSHYATQAQLYHARLESLLAKHRHRKQHRQQQRQQWLATLSGDALGAAFAQLEEQSRQDGIEHRHFKRERAAVLGPLEAEIAQADARIRELKQQRKQLSRQLQAQLHTAHWLTNFAGASLSLDQINRDRSMPTGTGDCCAPKLLHYAATHQLHPLALAEFWWGPANGDKQPGQFYGACAERCQPLMGFLLSGLAPDPTPLPILYEDEWLIAVHKPAGLLSVPGRSAARQDSVLYRLRAGRPDGANLMAVHRLDQDTSGVLVLARDRATHRHLSRQFQQRQVHKVYEAVLPGTLTLEPRMIQLPLWGNPLERPRQTVDWQRGKPSTTQVRVVAHAANQTRVEFIPLTGRTHQLRVHAADPHGLGVPILGDRLYGCCCPASRLHLHARELTVEHPQRAQPLRLTAPTPF